MLFSYILLFHVMNISFECGKYCILRNELLRAYRTHIPHSLEIKVLHSSLSLSMNTDRFSPMNAIFFTFVIEVVCFNSAHCFSITLHIDLSLFHLMLNV